MKSIETAFGPNSALVEELYEQYKDDPQSVPEHWKRYFKQAKGNESADNGKPSDTQDKTAQNGTPATQKETPKKKKGGKKAKKEQKRYQRKALNYPKGPSSKK